MAGDRKVLLETSPIALRPLAGAARHGDAACVVGSFNCMPQGGSRSRAVASRYAVVVQSDELPLSTWLVAPTSTSTRAASFRPEVKVGGVNTRVLAEQAAAVDPRRLGKGVGFQASTRCAALTRHCASSSTSERGAFASDENSWGRL
jgi:mRNA interferase MazF